MYAKKTIIGIFWTSSAQALQIVFQMVTLMILSRLLEKADYGIATNVFVIINFFLLFSNIGFGPAIIQRKNVSNNEASSIFWAGLSFAVILMLIVCAFSGILAKISKEPISPLLIIVSSCILPLTIITSIQQSIFFKNLNFRTPSLCNILGVFGGAIVGIILAYLGKGAWSLIFQTITGAMFTAFFYWVHSPFRPALHYKWDEVKPFLVFGGFLTGSTIINYFMKNADKFLISRYIGLAPLGVYNLSFNLMLFPLMNITQVLANVMYPVFSKLQDDKTKLAFYWSQTLRAISWLTFPIMVGLFIVADEFVPVIYGSKWLECIPIIRILAFAGVMHALISPIGSIYLSRGKSYYMFIWTCIMTIVFITGYFLGLKYGNGIKGVANAYLIVMGIIFIPSFIVPCRLLNTSLFKLFRAYASPLVSVIFMLITLVIFRRYMVLTHIPWPLMYLLLEVLLGSSSYFLFVLVFYKKEFIEIYKILIQKQEQ